MERGKEKGGGKSKKGRKGKGEGERRKKEKKEGGREDTAASRIWWKGNWVMLPYLSDN